MYNFKNLLLFIAVSTVLVACGGGGGGGSNPVPPPVQPDPEPTTVGGGAAKGIIIGGEVNVYLLVDGVVDDSSSIGSATTNENGEYSLELADSYDGSPVVVRITPAADGSTIMKCDVPSGCGTDSANDPIVFGGDYPLTDTTFSLEAILPEVGEDGVSVNITPLTNIAAQVAQTRLAADSSLDPALVADVANSQVADRFNIEGGDLTSLPIIDLTDPTAVANASADDVIYAALGAAIVEAVQNDGPTLTIEEAITLFSETFATIGVSGNTLVDGTTALDEIFASVQAVFAEVQTAADEADVAIDLSSALTELTTDIATAQAEEADQPDQGTPSPTAGSDELIQAKALVQDIRNLGNGVTLASLNDDASAFQLQIDAASAISSEHSGVAVEAVGIAVEAMGEASEAWEENNSLTSFETEEGISVSITAGENGLTLAVDQDITISEFVFNFITEQEELLSSIDVTVDLEGDLDLTVVESDTGEEPPENVGDSFSSGSGTYEFHEDISVDLTLTGTAVTELVRLTINEGAANGNLEITETGTFDFAGVEVPSGIDFEGSDERTESLLADLTLDLDITLEDLSDNLITFSGSLQVTLEGIDTTETSTENVEVDINDNGGFRSDTGSFDSSELFVTASFSLTGEFANSTGDSFAATLSLAADGNGVVFVESEQFSSSFDCPFDTECTFQDSETGSESGETVDNFVGFNFSLSFTAAITGISDSLELTLSGTRTGLEDGEADALIVYNGRRIEVVLNTSASTVTISNQDGVIISLEETEVEGESILSGTISVGDTQFATIEEEDLGIIIRYTDGTFESL